ncbi:hypothetical protein MICA_640 [Micavibrio aeruginosavorus ARL-13]|uniref:Uncharacterized protein n=1 Tax=Micavibrio aeruginosavorus (strain ARL-13) TaxID=856793 RepID=G2KP73_MICAA|nr:hypothetical protein MICA_640 [Micavibrio aeruginosavorus ARL-13]
MTTQRNALNYLNFINHTQACNSKDTTRAVFGKNENFRPLPQSAPYRFGAIH